MDPSPWVVVLGVLGGTRSLDGFQFGLACMEHIMVLEYGTLLRTPSEIVSKKDDHVRLGSTELCRGRGAGVRVRGRASCQCGSLRGRACMSARGEDRTHANHGHRSHIICSCRQLEYGAWHGDAGRAWHGDAGRRGRN